MQMQQWFLSLSLQKIQLYLIMQTTLVLFSVVFLITINCINYSTNTPRFLTTDKFQSGNGLVFSGFADSSTFPAPSFAFTFANPFPSIPALAYGIKEYKGNDTFTSQGYFLNQYGSLTSSGFTVTIQILVNTTVIRLQAAYIAIDPTFPYHVNSFDNVPLNLTSGNIMNISDNTTSDRIFTEVVNYTTLCGARTFNSFPNPISDHRVLLFLSTIQIRGTFFFQTGYYVSEQILSNDQYSISVTAKGGTTILRMHFSMIILNIKSVELYSGAFEIVFNEWQVTAGGGSFTFPQIFAPNFMLGLLSFVAYDRGCGIYYYWYYRNSGTALFDVYVQPSVVISGTWAVCALAVQVSNIFYLRHWICDAPYIYYNSTSKLCQVNCWDYHTGENSTWICKSCRYNCFQCLDTDITSCTECNPFDNRILNSFANDCQCQDGYYEPIIQHRICLACSLMVTDCNLCIVSAATVTCTECTPGHMLFTSNNTCVSCGIMNCVTCSQTSNVCFLCMMYYTQISTSPTSPCVHCGNKCADCDVTDLLTCTDCNPSDNRQLKGGSCDCLAGFYQNLAADYICQLCVIQILECSLCFANPISSQIQCTQCNSGFSLAPNNTCVPCSFMNCLSCNPNALQCYICDVAGGYFLNSITKLCELCLLSNCLQCLNATKCKVCDSANFYQTNAATGNCQQCSIQCTCNGYILPNVNGLCSTLCGDSLIKVFQTCDDGNVLANDGCSQTCQVEQHWQCVNLPSCCTVFFSEPLTIKAMNIHKVPYQNRINVTFSLSPSLNFLLLTDQQKESLFQIQSCSLTTDISQVIQNNKTSSVDFKKFISQNQISTSIYQFSDEFKQQIESAETFLIMSSFAYNMNIHEQNLTFSLNYVRGSNACLSKLSSSTIVQIKPQNNIPAVFLPQEEKQKFKVTYAASIAIQFYSYLIMAISALASAKIVGLQLFGVLQIAFFATGSIDNVNQYLSVFMPMKYLNGYNPQLSQIQAQQVPNRISAIRYDSVFVNNFNVMLIFIVGNIIFGSVILALGKLFNSLKISSIGKFSLTEFNISLVYFNAFNVSYSLGLHYAYTDKTNKMFILSSISVIVSICWVTFSMLHLILSEQNLYGQFKQKFKNNFESQIYCFVSLLFRITVGVYTSMMNEYQNSTLFILSVAIFYFIYCLACLPFRQTMHNYRAVFCHFLELYILFTVNYYRSLLISLPIDQAQKRTIPAAIQIYLILGFILISTICIIYQVYIFIKKCANCDDSTKVFNTHRTNKTKNKQKKRNNCDSNLKRADINPTQQNIKRDNTNNSEAIFKHIKEMQY